MTPQAEAVRARYRELGSTLEASIQVRREAEKRGNLHWHRLYERCWCGFLAVPAKYYTYDKGIQTNTQAQAEKAYLASLGRTDIPRTEKANKRTVGRPKKWVSEAERLRAYRERSRE